MPALEGFGKASRAAGRGLKATASGTARTSRWLRRNVGIARNIGGVGNKGMIRLLDMHAFSCAGDTLITIGLAGTIFFNVPAGEARSRVALYLLVTMVPFALLAPIVGPVLDRFRHGRRFALASVAPRVRAVFDRLRMSDWIQVFDSLDAAVDDGKSPPA